MKNLILTIILLFSICFSIEENKLVFGPLQTTIDSFKLNSVKKIQKGQLFDFNQTKNLEFKIDVKEIDLLKTEKGYDYLKIKNLIPLGNPGEPYLPIKTFILEFSNSFQISSVEVIKYAYREILTPLRIVPSPQPFFFIPLDTRKNQGELLPNKDIYNFDNFFPAKLLDFTIGKDNKKTYLSLKIFPVQYIPKEKKCIIFTNLTIQIKYIDTPYAFKQNNDIIDSQCIIICDEKNKHIAETLASFHTQKQISTSVVTTQWIESKYLPAENPPYAGYKDLQPLELKKYNYNLALKIISFLKNKENLPNLSYVILFGNTDTIPPSYYYYDDIGFGFYDAWIPTDFFYASPDYDYIPNYKIGRLPLNIITYNGGLNHENKSLQIVNKIINWQNNVSWDWFKNVVLAGGEPFNTLFFTGELMNIDLINKDYFNSMNILKLFKTNNKEFDGVKFLPYLTDTPCGIVIHQGHGCGWSFYFDSGKTSISSQELLYTENSNSKRPVILSISCRNGAYDFDIIHRIPNKYLTSAGEALILSKAGGIAYFGGSRINAGIAFFTYDKGNIQIEKQEHMAGLIAEVISSYAQGNSFLGELYQTAIKQFITLNDMNDSLNKRTLFEFVLLGDPVLSLPSSFPSSNYLVPKINTSKPEYYNKDDIPVFRNIKKQKIQLNIENSDSSLIEAIDSKTLSVYNQITGKTIEFIPSYGFNFYLVKAEDITSYKEGRLYIQTSSSFLSIDGDKIDWEKESLFPIASDPVEFTNPSEKDLDLETLYFSQDNTNYYLGFDTKAHNMNMRYGIAFDTISGGYTGEEKISQDALGNWITFKNHGVDFEIYLQHITWIPWAEDVKLEGFYQWNPSKNNWEKKSSEGIIFAYGQKANFIELTFPKTLIGNPEEFYFILFTTGVDLKSSPAQDSIPSDPNTYTQMTLTQQYANTLNNFIKIKNILLEDNLIASKLYQNYPNPFDCKTYIPYTIGNTRYGFQDVKIKIYNVLGQLVRELNLGKKVSGKYLTKNKACYWDGKDISGKQVSSGIYFYELEINNKSIGVKQFLLLK